MPSGSMEYDQEHENLIEQIRAMEERLELLERHALTSQDIKANKIAVGLEAVLADLSDGDIASIPWTPYQDDSIIVGWASYTTKEIRYTKIGDLVFVQFEIRGTSDNTIATMTLPYSQDGITSNIDQLIRIHNDGSWGTGFAAIPPASYTLAFYSSTAGAVWHVSAADKWVIGGLCYKTA